MDEGDVLVKSFLVKEIFFAEDAQAFVEPVYVNFSGVQALTNCFVGTLGATVF